MKERNQETVNENCIKNDSGNNELGANQTSIAWEQHYQKLLNEEFEWDKENL